MTEFAQILWSTQINPITEDKAELKSAALRKKGIHESFNFNHLFEESIEVKKPAIAADSYVRISSIGYMCERREVLAAKMEEDQVEVRPITLELIFGLGHSVHDLMQNHIFGPAKLLIGDWECKYCGHTHTDCIQPDVCTECCFRWRCSSCEEIIESEKRVDTCPTCGNGSIVDEPVNPFRYVEQTVKDEELGIGGHYDGGVMLDGKLWVLEIKSMRGDLFYKLTEPQESHIEQALLYAHLKGAEGALIVYVNKNGRNKDDFYKEYTVPMDKSILKRALDKVSSVRKHIAAGTIPERTLCINRSSYRARSCPLKEICFADKPKRKSRKK